MNDLKKDYQFLEKVIESLPEGVVVADNQMNFVIFNKAAERVLGIGNENVDQEEWVDLYGCFKLDGTKFKTEELPIVQASKGKTLHDLRMLIKNQYYPKGVYISVNAGPIKEGKVINGAMASFRDITEEIKSKVENRVLREIMDDAVQRELRMIELKKEVNQLSESLGKKPPYDVD